MAQVPSVQAVKDYVAAFTEYLKTFRMWDATWEYQAGDPCYYDGNFYYANPLNPPDVGQDPVTNIDRWNMITGSDAAQTVRRRIKIVHPGVKVVSLEDDLGLSPAFQYRVYPFLASEYPYIRHIYVERQNGDLRVFLYSDTEPYTYPRVGYIHGSTRGTNVKIGTKLVGTFYLGKWTGPDPDPPPTPGTTPLKIGSDLTVGDFTIGYIPAEDRRYKVTPALMVGSFYIGAEIPEDPQPEIPDEELPGIFVDLFIQREVTQ